MIVASIVSLGYVDTSKEINFKKASLKKKCKDHCRVRLREEVTSEITGVVVDAVTILEGDYFSNTELAKAYSFPTHAVADRLEEFGAKEDSSLLMFDMRTNKFASLLNEDMCTILNNLKHKEVLEAILPLDVDYIGIINSNCEHSERLDYVAANATEDILVAEVK